MKLLGIFGTVIGLLSGLLAVYVQFIVVPAAEIAETAINFGVSQQGLEYYGTAEHNLNQASVEAVTDFGIILLFAGLLALLVSIFPAIKKQKFAWIGVILGLISSLIGAAHGTHLFD